MWKMFTLHENYKWIDALPCLVSDYNVCIKVRAADLDVYLVEKILRRRGDKVYMKWLGFDNSHNFWIHKDNVI